MSTSDLRVLFHFDASHRLRERLAGTLTGLEVVWCAESDEQRFAELLPSVDVLWHVLRPVTAADLERGSRLRLIQKFGTGVNTIDLEAARVRGVAVCNLPGANAPAVAEAALGLLLAAARRLVHLDRQTRADRGWPVDCGLAESATEIGGRTVGLVGYGAVARRFEAVLAALGAEVLHTSQQPTTSSRWRTMDELFAQCDVVSLHVPLTAGTEHLVNRDRLTSMPRGGILINTARGGLIDEAALYGALNDGRLAAAGLDVFGTEPVRPDNPLLTLDNVVVSPHVAWLTEQTVRRCCELSADNCRRLMAGRPLHHLVA